jgi:hypothetical protein
VAEPVPITVVVDAPKKKKKAKVDMDQLRQMRAQIDAMLSMFS